jgi:hypothetical protein
LTTTSNNTDEEQLRCLTLDWYYNDVFGGMAERLALTAKEETTKILVDTTNVAAAAAVAREEEYQYLPKRVTFEKNPNYIRSWDVPRLMQQIFPWTHKFVVILRSPMDRAYSHYQMEVQRQPRQTNESFDFYVRQEIQEIVQSANGEEPLSICDIDESCQHGKDRHRTKHYVRNGIYAPQVHHWLQYYPRSDFLFLNYDDLDRNTTDVYRRIVEFVGLSANHLWERNEEDGTNDLQKLFRRHHTGNHNKKEERVRRNQKSNDTDSNSKNTNQPSKRRLGSPMSKETRAYLQEYFKPYHAQLLKELENEEWNSVEWT